ncbi:MAG: dATP pyrophosphohydrolase [Alphaproteobacteria bacterium]|nr:dATP pyrophosphohydrolase [Alphaproteobacteria bacterium]
MSVTIRPVTTGADWDAFFEAAHVCQGHDPVWVPPLRMVQREKLNPKVNPWFDHGEAAFWVAIKDGQPVGRISAQIDRSHLSLRNDSTGFWGFFETIDDADVAAGLIAAAEEWLKSKGLARMLGPFSLNINEESGLLVDGFAAPPRMMMGHAQPHYQKHVENAGLTKSVDMLAYLTPMDTALPYKQLAWLQRSLDRDKRLSLRHLDVKQFDQDIATIVRIFNAAWAENWGFIPLTERDVAHMAKEMKLFLIPELVWFAEISGEPAAMCVALPDPNEMIRDLGGRLWPFNWLKLGWRILNKKTWISGTRVPFMGVLPAYKNKTVGSVLALQVVGAVRRESLRLGFPVCEMSWVLEGNTQTRHSIEEIGGRVYKTYRMYEKKIA